MFSCISGIMADSGSIVNMWQGFFSAFWEGALGPFALGGGH